MFKRVSSMVLAVMMLLTMVGSMTAFAAAEPEIKVTVSANKAEAERGEEVTFTYYAESTKAWDALSFESRYEPSLLTFVTAVAEGGQTDVYDNNGVITVAAVGCDAAAGKTAVATVKFTVKTDVALGTNAAVTAVATVAGGNNAHLVLDTNAASAVVKVVCFHKNGSVVSNGATTHAATCPTCGNVTENCNFIVDKGTVTNVAHGQYTYKLWGCTLCTNTKKENLTLVSHNRDGVKSLGNYNAQKQHQIICKADGAVMGTEACSFTDTSGCQITCDKCKAVYNNPNLLTAAHKDLNEHYYAPTAGVPGKITENCTACGYEETLKTGTWSFTDVSSDKWYYHAVTFNNAYELFTGTSATTFSPSKTINRAQAATVLSRMLLAEINRAAGKEIITQDTLNAMSQNEINAFVDTYLNTLYGLEKVEKIPAFTDVPAGSYYGGHVRLMATLGIVNGKSTTSFAPSDTITRQELAALMARLVKVLEKINGETYNSFGAPIAAYSDASSVSSWAKTDVEWVRTTGLMKGKNGNAFVPKGTATRAEVATLMMRLKIAIGDITTHNIPASSL